MKKFAKVLLVVTLSLLFSTVILCGCTPSQTEKTEHDYSQSHWIGCPEGHYKICSECIQPGPTYNHNFGNTTINGEYLERTCSLCGFVEKKEINAPIVVQDEQKNSQLLEQLNTQLEVFSNDFHKSNYLSVVAEIDGSTVETKATNTPFYLEISANNNGIVYATEDNKIFSYEEKDNGYVNRNFVCMAENFEQIEQDDFSELDYYLGEMPFDATTCNVTLENSTYTICAYIKDLLGQDYLQALKLYLQQFGIDSSALNKMICTVAYTFGNNSLKIEVSATFKFVVNNEIKEVESSTTYTLDLTEFQPKNYHDGNYTISAPDCVQEVTQLTDITQVVTSDTYYTFIKANLKKGQYALRDLSVEWESAINFQWFDETYSAMDMCGLPDFGFGAEQRYINIITVPEDGLYYFSFDGWLSQLKFTHFNYTDTYDIQNPITVQNNQVAGTIEGCYDLNFYNYVAESDGVLILSNTGESDVEIMCKQHKYDNSNAKTLATGQQLFVRVWKGDNRFFVCNRSASQSFDYTLSTQLYFDNTGESDNLETMTELTNQWSEHYYLTGYDFPTKYLILHVQQAGTFVFQSKESEQFELNNDVMIVVKTLNGEYVDYQTANQYVLQEGDYIVELMNNSHILCVAQVKYSFIAN